MQHYSLVNYGWRSEVYSDVNNSIYSKILSYGMLNLTTGIRIPYGKNDVNLSLWAKNALYIQKYIRHLIVNIQEANRDNKNKLIKYL